MGLENNTNIDPNLEIIQIYQNYSISPQRGNDDFINVIALDLISNETKILLDSLNDYKTNLKNIGLSDLKDGFYISIDMLPELVAANLSTKNRERLIETISGSIQQILDIKNNGKRKIGYLYPVILKEGDIYKIKIGLVTLKISKEVSVNQFRTTLFTNSQPHLEAFFNGIIKLQEDFPLLVGEDQWFTPELASIEFLLIKQIVAAFKPYEYLSVNDFIRDLITNWKNSKNVESLTPNFHIFKESKKSDKESFNESFFKKIFYSLEIFFIKRAGSFEFPLFSGKLAKYAVAYSPSKNSISNEIPSNDRVAEFIQLLNDFPYSEYKDPKKNDFQRACNTGKNLLISLQAKLENSEADSLKERQSEIITNLQNQIIERSRDKKILFLYHPKTYLKQFKLKEIDELEVDADLMVMLQQKMVYFEQISPDGQKDYWIADPDYFARIIINLRNLSLQNPNIKPEFDLAKSIYLKTVKAQKIPLNKKLDKSEIEECEKILQSKDSAASQVRETSQKSGKPVIIFISFITFIIILAVFFFLSQITETPFFLLIGFPLSIFAGILNYLNLKGKAEKEDESTSESKKDSPAIQINKVVEPILFKENFNTIADRFFDRNTLRRAIEKNLVVFKSRIKVLSGEKDSEKVIATIENVIMSHSAVIRVPNKVLEGTNFSDLLIMKRSDLKQTLFREQLLKYFKDKIQTSKKEFHPYYDFLLHTIEIDYARYLRTQNPRK